MVSVQAVLWGTQLTEQCATYSTKVNSSAVFGWVVGDQASRHVPNFLDGFVRCCQILGVGLILRVVGVVSCQIMSLCAQVHSE